MERSAVSGPFLGMFFDRGVMGHWATQGDEKRLLFNNYSAWKHRPPLCHLDRSVAQWRDLRFSGPFLEMFFDRGVMGHWAHQGDEKRLLFSNYSAWKHRPPLCHLDRSVAQWRDLRFSGPFLEMFFDRAYYTTPPIKGSVKLALPVSTRPAKRASASEPVALTV